jgi:putative membrane protein
MRHETILLSAEFDPRLKTYWMLLGALLLLSTVIGVVVLPFWLLGLGAYVNRRR